MHSAHIKGFAIGNKVKLSDGSAIQTLNELHALTSQAKKLQGTYQISQTVISTVMQGKRGCVCRISQTPVPFSFLELFKSTSAFFPVLSESVIITNVLSTDSLWVIILLNLWDFVLRFLPYFFFVDFLIDFRKLIQETEWLKWNQKIWRKRSQWRSKSLQRTSQTNPANRYNMTTRHHVGERNQVSLSKVKKVQLNTFMMSTWSRNMMSPTTKNLYDKNQFFFVFFFCLRLFRIFGMLQNQRSVDE